MDLLYRVPRLSENKGTLEQFPESKVMISQDLGKEARDF